MRIACGACGAECEIVVTAPALLRHTLPRGWRPRRIDGRVFILCDICGKLRQFVGGLSPYLQRLLGLPPNVEIELPELTDLPDAWLRQVRKRGGMQQRHKATMMTDINKMITSRQSGEDPQRTARAAEIAGWDATGAAAKEGVQLSDRHREVIRFMQRHYLDNGQSKHARELSDLLAEQLAGKGGRKYLFELFPGGPVTQGGRIAGIPVPADAADRSFDSVL